MTRWAVPVILLTATLAASGQTTNSASRPAVSREEQVAQLIDFLNTEHGKLLKSSDWIERSLAIISLAKLPGQRATDQIMTAMKKDETPFVRLVAWQAMLARAKSLSETDYQNWLDTTAAMAGKDFFRGGTRIGLLRVMAQNPPSKSAKILFVRIFAQCSALEPRDMPVLDALGETLAAWRSPDLVEFLFNSLSVLNDAYRAEYVLQRAGIRAPWAGEHQDLGSAAMWKFAIDNYAAAVRSDRAHWQQIKDAAPQAWKSLEPQYFPNIDLDAPIDPNSPEWRRETELGRVDARPLDVVFVVDATGSMGHLLQFLKRDLGQIKLAMELISGQPRIGMTFYRDNGDTFVTRSLKLTERLNTLDAFIGTMDAKGGGDRPEAVLEALTEAIKDNPWQWKRDGRRALILMTDAPPHPETQAECVKIAKGCADNHVQLHIAKVRDPKTDQDDLSALDELATAAGTEPMWLPAPERQPPPYTLPDRVDHETLAGVRLATAPPADSADRQILKRLIASALNPKYADRVDPIVDLMLAVTAVSEPEKRSPFGVPTPAGVDMGVPGPVRDVQAR